MKSFLKNVVLLAVVLILSYFTTEYFGSLYNSFAPLHDRSLLGLSTSDLISFVGFPFSYIFFTTLLFQILGGASKNKWNIWLLVPALLFFGSGDIKHIYLPIILGLLAFALAKILNMIIVKLRH